MLQATVLSLGILPARGTLCSEGTLGPVAQLQHMLPWMFIVQSHSNATVLHSCRSFGHLHHLQHQVQSICTAAHPVYLI